MRRLLVHLRREVYIGRHYTKAFRVADGSIETFEGVVCGYRSRSDSYDVFYPEDNGKEELKAKEVIGLIFLYETN